MIYDTIYPRRTKQKEVSGSEVPLIILNMKIFSLKQTDKRMMSLDKLFKELRLFSLINFSDDLSAKKLEKKDIFIFPHWSIGTKDIVGEKAKIIKNFVKKGGICWIMSQRQRGWYSFLPPHLKQIEIENKYIDLDSYSPGTKPYICPWILEREHPIWNKPNYIDEGDFVFWELKIDKEIYNTSATHIVYLPKTWDIIGGYADEKTKLKDRGALIAEARYGRGLFFWTQIFSPEITYKEEKSFTKKFIQNIFSYFKDFKENKVFKVKIEPEQWTVLAGEKVKIKTISNEEIKNVELEILTPQGKNEKIIGREYVPKEGGTYYVKAKIIATDKKYTFAHTFFKATKRFTPFRFLTHTHFQTDWTPEHLGTLFGVCRRINIDGVVLASGLFYGDKDFYLGVEEIQKIDNPAVRFFIGEEIHCMHNYTIKEGGVKQFDNRRHVTTVGCITYPYSQEYWRAENLVNVHKKNGIAIVAHPGSQPWWVKSQNGHTFEAIEIDRSNPRIWDKVLKKKKFITGVSGVDNLGPNRLFFPASPNVGWFDKPFNLNSLIDTILMGRITKIATYPYIPYSVVERENYFSFLKKEVPKGRNNILWFDINNQIPGGILYVTDKVKLNIKAKSSFPLKLLRIVKEGDRNYRKIKINNKVLHYSEEEKINKDIYYRVEIDSFAKYPYGSCSSFANPIFIKKIDGPKDSYFYFQNLSSYYFNKKNGRFMANLTQLKDIKFHNNIWEITFFEPKRGKIFIGGKIKKIELDKKRIKGKREKGEMVVSFIKGKHTLKGYF